MARFEDSTLSRAPAADSLQVQRRANMGSIHDCIRNVIPGLGARHGGQKIGSFLLWPELSHPSNEHGRLSNGDTPTAPLRTACAPQLFIAAMRPC